MTSQYADNFCKFLNKNGGYDSLEFPFPVVVPTFKERYGFALSTYSRTHNTVEEQGRTGKPFKEPEGVEIRELNGNLTATRQLLPPILEKVPEVVSTNVGDLDRDDKEDYEHHIAVEITDLSERLQRGMLAQQLGGMSIAARDQASENLESVAHPRGRQLTPGEMAEREAVRSANEEMQEEEDDAPPIVYYFDWTETTGKIIRLLEETECNLPVVDRILSVLFRVGRVRREYDQDSCACLTRDEAEHSIWEHCKPYKDLGVWGVRASYSTRAYADFDVAMVLGSPTLWKVKRRWGEAKGISFRYCKLRDAIGELRRFPPPERKTHLNLCIWWVEERARDGKYDGWGYHIWMGSLKLLSPVEEVPPLFSD